MIRRLPRWLAPAFAISLLAPARFLAAQQPLVGERQALEARAARAESSAVGDSGDPVRSDRLAEATAIRARLRNGDFHAGDRITVWVNGETALSNTFTVREGNILSIPTIPDISLTGVLRSELRDVVIREIKRFIKNPEVQVTTQIQVAVLGAVGHPGFYSVAPGVPLTELLMTAGGPTPSSDFGRSKIVRGSAVLASAKELKQVLSANKTLDDVGIQTGDQLVIGERPRRFDRVTAVVSLLSVAATTLIFVRR